jgi:hypothetical protein
MTVTPPACTPGTTPVAEVTKDQVRQAGVQCAAALEARLPYEARNRLSGLRFVGIVSANESGRLAFY